MMRRLLICLIVLLLMTGTVRARELAQGDLCVVQPDQTVVGNLFVVCRELRIDGHVTGSVIGAATTAEINGTVDGSILMAAGQLDVQGVIGKDIAFAGVVLRLMPGARFESASTDLFSLTLTTLLAEETTLPGSVTGIGYQMLINGTVNDEINFWGSGLAITGQVDGNVDATVGDGTSDGLSRFPTFVIPFPFDLELFKPGLRVAEDARLGGYLHYSGPTLGEVPPALLEQTAYTPITTTAEFTPVAIEDDTLERNLNLYITQAIREFITLALIGVLVLLLFPRALQDPLRYLQARPLTCMGVSVFTLIVLIPIGLAVLVLSLFIVFVLSLFGLNDLVLSIGALLGIINVGGVSLFAFVFGFLSRVVVCFALGRMLLHLVARYRPTPQGQFASLFIGVGLMALATPLPVIGLIVYGIAAALGLGAVLSVVQGQIRAARENNTLPPLPEDVPPPPPLAIEPLGPGMDNLPPGFRMWDD
ncbi:MAG: polymer-forming cytoskeletal protein [Anaerolineae bacterium]